MFCEKTIESRGRIPQTTTTVRTYLIQNIQTPQEFWSNDLGWVSVESADRFAGILLNSPEGWHRAVLRIKSGSELNLPLGGMWIPEFVNPYQCQNCDYADEYKNLPPAKDIRMRTDPGEPYTDVECPECGALCFPMDAPALERS